MHEQTSIIKMEKHAYQSLQTAISVFEAESGQSLSVPALIRETIEQQVQPVPESKDEFEGYGVYVIDSSDAFISQSSHHHRDDNKWKDVKLPSHLVRKFENHCKVVGKKWVLHGLPITNDSNDKTWDLSGTVGASQILFGMALCQLMATRLSAHLEREKLPVDHKRGNELNDDLFIDFFCVQFDLYRSKGYSKGKCWVKRCQLYLMNGITRESTKISVEDLDLDPEYILTEEQQERVNDAIRVDASINGYSPEQNAFYSTTECESQGRCKSDAHNLSKEQEVDDRIL